VIEWSGPIGDIWAQEWRRTDRSFAGLAPHLNAAILERASSTTAKIADIGCGAGATSIAVATALPRAQVIGIDISASLIEVAAARGRGLENLRFETGSIEERLPDIAPVDLLMSRHGVMFFPDPVSAFAQLRRSSSARASLVFSCFRPLKLNPWTAELIVAVQGALPPPPATYTPGPFAFADPAFVKAVLGEAGWRQARCTPVDFTYRAGEGADPVGDALDFFQRIGPTAPVLRAAPTDQRAAMLDRIATVLRRYHTGEAVDFPAAAWLWSAQAA
jgi:SAM-dependent methyltransferase